jgi:uncharacterized membrane protein YqhA
LDDLKEKVARLVIVVLVIEFFQLALKLPYEQAQDQTKVATSRTKPSETPSTYSTLH